METNNTNQQSQPNPTSPQIEAPLNPVPKRRINLLILIVAIFLILIVGVTAYYLGTKGSNKSATQIPLPQIQTPSTPSFKNRLVYLKMDKNNSGNTTLLEYDLNSNKDLNFSGNSLVQPNDQGEPSKVLSPNKTKLAIISKNNNGELIIFDLNNLTSKTLVTNLWPKDAYYNNNYINSEVVWSPNGKQLAFNAGANGGPQVYIINSDGTNQKQITSDPGTSKVSIDWSPDNKKLVYRTEQIHVFPSGGTGYQGNTAELKIFNLDESKETQVVPADDQSREVLGLNHFYSSRITISWRNNQELISLYSYPFEDNPLKGVWTYFLETNKATQLLAWNLDPNGVYRPLNGYLELEKYDEKAATLSIKVLKLVDDTSEDFVVPNYDKPLGHSLSENHQFVTYQNSKGFWIYNLQTKQAVQVMDLAGKDYTYAGGNMWSPDYKKLIFGAHVATGGGSGNIQVPQSELDNQGTYMVNSDGTSVTKLPIDEEILTWF